jgi:hypothetical protein
MAPLPVRTTPIKSASPENYGFAKGGRVNSALTTRLRSYRAAEQIVAGERGIAHFSTNLVRRGLRVTARAT